MKWVFALLFMLLSSQFVLSDTLTVSVKMAPPFVMQDDRGELAGFSIDLARAIASELGSPIEFVVDPDLSSHLQSVEEGRVDFGIAATTITSEREYRMDFSHPFYESSMGIMILEEERKGVASIFFSGDVLLIFLGILAYIVLCGHVIWLIEKGRRPFSRRYLPGIGMGMWWTVVTMSTVGYGDAYPKKSWGRVFGGFVIFSGIILFSVAIAGLSSAMTVSKLTPAVEGPEDLVGNPVAVIENTLGARIADGLGMRAVPAASLDEARLLLDEGRVDAVVHDTPLLLYYANAHRGVMVVEKTFSPSSYGIAFQKGNGLREDVNVALLKVIESGRRDTLEEKWFGKV